MTNAFVAYDDMLEEREREEQRDPRPKKTLRRRPKARKLLVCRCPRNGPKASAKLVRGVRTCMRCKRRLRSTVDLFRSGSALHFLKPGTDRWKRAQKARGRSVVDQQVRYLRRELAKWRGHCRCGDGGTLKKRAHESKPLCAQCGKPRKK